MAMGLLAVALDFSRVAPDEFHDWYDTEHIPERRRLPGFLTLERWMAAQEPAIAAATYDLQSLKVLQSAGYCAITGENVSPWSRRLSAKYRRILRFEGEQLTPDVVAPQGAGALLMVGMNVDAAAEQEFNRWYDEEHLPALKQLPGVLCARRFRDSTGPMKYLATYHLSSVDVCESAAWKKAVDTPWTRRMHGHVRDRLRIACTAYQSNT
jgi:hypothetical protein